MNHECCESMGNQCGKVPMPEVHDCCPTITPTGAVVPELKTTPLPLITLGLELTPQLADLRWSRFESPTVSPPLLPDHFNILRI
jgi:hypothetical protein